MLTYARDSVSMQGHCVSLEVAQQVYACAWGDVMPKTVMVSPEDIIACVHIHV